MADLNKENFRPTCTTTIKKHKKNKLTVPKKNNAGVPFKPKEDSQNNISEIIEIKENTQYETRDQDYELVIESDVADAVLDIMDVSKLPPNMEEMAAQLDDQAYVSTRRQKRRLDHEYHDEEPKKKKTLFQKTLFQKLIRLKISPHATAQPTSG